MLVSFDRFTKKYQLKSNSLKKLFKHREITDDMLNILSSSPEDIELTTNFEIVKGEVRAGNHGETAQFGFVYYLDEQTNNYFQRLSGLNAMLPLAFALDKQNYARYGSYYGKA